MRGWRAWYADGSAYSSSELAWQELPSEGVVGVVVYEDPPYRRIVAGGDWYWLEGGEVHVSDTHDRWGEFAPRPDVACSSCVKKSGVMDDDAWREAQREMMEAREWP